MLTRRRLSSNAFLRKKGYAGMSQAEQYPYLDRDPRTGVPTCVPYLPLTLTLGTRSTRVFGLLDTGAAINVLPHDIGLQLGAVWDKQTTHIPLAGNLAASEARAVGVTA